MMIVLCRWTRGCPSTVYDIFFLSVPQQQESNTNKSFSNHSYSVTMMMMMMPTHGNLLSPEDKKWFMLPFCSSQSILRFDGRRRWRHQVKYDDHFRTRARHKISGSTESRPNSASYCPFCLL